MAAAAGGGGGGGGGAASTSKNGSGGAGAAAAAAAAAAEAAVAEADTSTTDADDGCFLASCCSCPSGEDFELEEPDTPCRAKKGCSRASFALILSLGSQDSIRDRKSTASAGTKRPRRAESCAAAAARGSGRRS